MHMTTRKSPSRVKYEEKNPMISMRLTSDLKKMLDSLKGDRSYPNLIKDLIKTTGDERTTKMITDARLEGIVEGGKRARKKYEIKYKCAVCGKDMTMYPGDKDHQAAVKALKGWSHEEC